MSMDSIRTISEFSKARSLKEVGEIFFMPQTPASARKELLKGLIQRKEYARIIKIVYSGYINARYDMAGEIFRFADYGENSDIHAHYFSLFLRICADCGLVKSDIIPFIVAVCSRSGSQLSVWKAPAEAYIVKEADTDYDFIYNAVCAYGRDFKLIPALIKADCDRTVKRFTLLSIYGRGINKLALRKALLPYKNEVFYVVQSVYPGLNFSDKLAAVRLLCVFKNDSAVADYLNGLKKTENSKVLRNIITPEPRKKNSADYGSIVDFFQNAMVLGTPFTVEEFTQKYLKAPYSKVADMLFFSVYKNGELVKIVMADNGKVLDLNNTPVTLSDDCTVKVLHPVELNYKFEFVKRLNVKQPFLQIKRNVYTPSEFIAGSTVIQLGATVKVGELSKRLRCSEFKSIDNGGKIAICRNGILCAVTISPLCWRKSEKDDCVMIKSVSFYDDSSVVKMGGKRFTNGVLPISALDISARDYSEFMYSVYALSENK